MSTKSFLLLFVFLGFGLGHAQEAPGKKVLNWYNGKDPGMNTDKTYKMLKKMKSETVVVAVIDSGIDTEHPDLKGQIWVNEDEIPNNGIDDDKNGYIDDIHGWNFLGNSKGENLNETTLEVTRIYAKLKPKFENMDSEEAKGNPEYTLYKLVKKEYEKKLKEAQSGHAEMKAFLENILPNMEKEVGEILKNPNYTLEDVKKWKPEDGQQKRMRQMVIMKMENPDFLKDYQEYYDYLKTSLNYHLNLEFEGRKTIIGDNPDDFTDTNYGNNDVKGPDALHGTHVGGIIGSLRGNKLGGDGVATNVKLMSLRAVPDGDEYDKDIALAIRYAVDNGAKVINMSFGKAFSPHQKQVYEAMRYAEEKDVLLVHAAGNDSKDIDKEPNFPATMYEFQEQPNKLLLTIGASTRYKKGNLAAPFSNYGQKHVDIFAPGLEIYNTIPEGEYKLLQGTSMAAPMVAGVAALLKSYFPKLTMLEIKEIILKSGKDYGTTEHKKPGSEKSVAFSTLSNTGKVVDLKAAVEMAMAK